MNTTPVATKGNQTKRRTKKAASIQKGKSDPPVEVVINQGPVLHTVPSEPAKMEEFDPDQFLSQIRDQMKQDKDDKELIELAQVLEDQLPDELLPPTTPVICPLHPAKSLKEFVSKMGDEFVKCSLEGCPVFCAKKDLGVYAHQICNGLHPEVRKVLTQENFFNFPLALRLSRSEKNPNRLFVTSKDKTYNFFQWGYEPLREENKGWLALRSQDKTFKQYRIKDIRQYVNPKRKFTEPINWDYHGQKKPKTHQWSTMTCDCIKGSAVKY